jgi:hypothetical protein
MLERKALDRHRGNADTREYGFSCEANGVRLMAGNTWFAELNGRDSDFR